VRTDVSIPQPPFFGSRVVLDIPIENVSPTSTKLPCSKVNGSSNRENIGRRIPGPGSRQRSARYEELKERCEREGLLGARVVYGYYPAQSAGNDLVVYDPHSGRSARVTFPRQPAA